MNLYPPNLEAIAGTIERITFHSEETGFCVLRVKVKGKRELVTVVGKAAGINAGEYIECQGIWFNDKEYGIQFKAESLKSSPPTTLEGMEKYLGSGLIKGIGPHFARVLITVFGASVFDVIENETDRLMTLAGIGDKRKKMIIKAWAEQKAVHNIMIFLQSHGIGTARAVKIYKVYGDNAIDTVRDNPYQLALDITGIGFKTADSLAMKLGVGKDSIKRAEAGIRHVLQEFASEGHCAIEQEQLVKSAVELLEIPEDVIKQAIINEIGKEHLVLDKIAGKDCLFLAALFRAEEDSAANIRQLQVGLPPWSYIQHQNAISWVEKQTGVTLSPSQRNAVILALQSKVVIITGGPGVGKTTIINSILKIVRAKKIAISLCAPTGRAAKRLSEATGLTAKTIHRLLEYDPKLHAFKHNQYNPLATDMVVIDEASMIDIMLWHHIVKAIPPHASVLVVGDIDQLPSVGPGAVLVDMIGSRAIKVVRLTEIFRQAANSQIIINAHRINQGLFPQTKIEANSDFHFIQAETPEEIQAKLIDMVTKEIPEKYGFDAKRDIQVLTPMHRGGLGSAALNSILQNKLNSAGIPKINKFGITYAPGDKVIQNTNNYTKDVFNGDIGIISRIDLEESEVHINFDGRLVAYDFNELDEIALAYATSIHKSQGSEYPAVVVPVTTQHYMLLARNLLYTAVTRGKKLVVLIGQTKALAIAVKNATLKTRITNLQARLQNF